MAEIELEPDVVADETVRHADFRIRTAGDSWTYVEVTRPNISQARERLAAILDQITGLVLEVNREFALEVFFRREPEDHELGPLLERIPQFCGDGTSEREEIGDIALLLLSDVRPGQITPHQLPDEPSSPRLGAAKVLGGGGQPWRHIVARVPYADTRADKFLSDEAAQLSKDYPGLIMVDISNEPSAFASWGPILVRRFQPAIHTRVSGLCLFAPRLLPTSHGLLWVPQVRLYINAHAKIHLPGWIKEILTDAANDFGMCFDAVRRPVSGL